jgi:signal recognition particle subunit SRP54
VFETLTSRLQAVFKDLGRSGKIRKEDLEGALRQLRLALLEADVDYQLVAAVLERVRLQAEGEVVSRAINPSQQILRILHAELVSSLGPPAPLGLKGEKPRLIMLVGLQGSGKTTSAAKLAAWLRLRGERPWLIGADVRRPAAGEQLRQLAERCGVQVYAGSDSDPIRAAQDGLQAAARAGASVAILDTAGRSQIDEELMNELRAVWQAVHPTEVLLVADAMTGQAAVDIARGFGQALKLDGLILAKMDGDARGGAAISMRAVTGVPIKFLGNGEALDALEPLDPERLAGRILGMGDVLSLLERAERKLDRPAAEKSAARLIRGEFSLDDFAEQLQQVRRLGSIGQVLQMLPGQPAPQFDEAGMERQLVRTQAILNSMTAVERRKPDLLNASRKRRIATGSGTSVQEINQLLRQYRQMQKVFKQVGKRGLPDLLVKLR